MDTNRFETRGIVLSEAPFTETSKRLSLFTRRRGKLAILAKGANSAKSQIFALTQPGVEGNFDLKSGRSFAYIRQGTLIKDHSPLRKTYPQIVATSFFLEVVDKSLVEGQENTRLYDLLSKTLTVLETGFSKSLLNAFLIKTLTFLGYRPSFQGEEEENTGKGGFFDPKSGIIGYGVKPPGGTYLQEEDLNYLKTLLYSSLDQINARSSQEDLLTKLLIEMFYIHLELGQFQTLDLISTL